VDLWSRANAAGREASIDNLIAELTRCVDRISAQKNADRSIATGQLPEVLTEIACR
jgi:hypothetical protein